MPGETIEEQQAFLARLDDLPSELLQYKIMPHLTPEILVWLTRENYLKYKFAGKSYPSFLRFLLEYAKDSNAKRVHAILESIPDDNVRGKGHKRIITTTNRWTN